MEVFTYESAMIELARLMAGVFALSEILHRIPGLKRFDVGLLNIALGGISGVVAFAAGWLHLSTPGFMAWFVALFCGVMCAALAGLVHDKLWNPLTGRKLKKTDADVLKK